MKPSMGHRGSTNVTGEGGRSMVKTTAGILVFWGMVLGMAAAIGFLSVI
jgi:hypothetical protein